MKTPRYLPLLATLALTACNVAKPAPQLFDSPVIELAANPEATVAQIEANAAASGFAVVSDGVETVFVDFGTREMTIPVPTEYGVWGTRTVFRNTAVKPSAVYRILPTPTGVRVTIHNNPVYWHPDFKVWLPGPHDLSPGREWLAGLRLEGSPVAKASPPVPAPSAAGVPARRSAPRTLQVPVRPGTLPAPPRSVPRGTPLTQPPMPPMPPKPTEPWPVDTRRSD